MRKSTFGALAAGLVLVTATVGALVFPGAAVGKTQPAVVVGAGQKIDVTNPGLLQGPGYAYSRAGYIDPGLCEDGGPMDPFCDLIPIRVALTPEQLKKNIYLLLVNVDWPGENLNIPATATPAVPQLAITVWEDPIVEDDEVDPPCPEPAPGVPPPEGTPACPLTDERPGGDEPLFETGLDPKPLRWGTLIEKDLTFSATISNYAGANEEYTLTVEIVEVEGVPDLSEDEGVVDLSADEGSVNTPTAPSSTFDGFADPGAPATSAIGSLGLADVIPDTDLDRLGVQGDEALGFDEDTAQLLANRNFRDIRAPGDETTWALVLWLLVVPLAVAGAAAGWALRRRATLLANI